MQRIEQVRVLAFLAVVGLVVAGSLLEVIRDVTRRRRVAKGEQIPPRTVPSRLVRGVLYSSLFVGVLCIAYGFLVEPYWLDVTEHRIETTRLPAGHRGVRIAHISDLHCDPVERCEDELISALRAARPDVVLFTGDAINSRAGLPLFKKTLTAIAEIAPTYCIRGNWDTWYWSSVDLFGDTGAFELTNQSALVEVDGAALWIGGVAYEDVKNASRLLEEMPSDVFSVFLYHSPDLVLAAAAQGADLYLAGHTHGGQVALPWYGALITFSQFGKRFEGGRYRVRNTTAYVNRGLGMEGGDTPRVRFCARPELTILDLVPAD